MLTIPNREKLVNISQALKPYDISYSADPVWNANFDDVECEEKKVSLFSYFNSKFYFAISFKNSIVVQA